MIADFKDSLKSLDFEKIVAKAKPIGIAAICLIAMFAAGFGVGQGFGKSGGDTTPIKRSTSSNYTTNGTKTSTDTAKTGEGPTKTPSPIKSSQSKTTTMKITTPVDLNNCKIKGSKSKIYHMPGGAFYNRTTPTVCFDTEEQAIGAGFTKSSR